MALGHFPVADRDFRGLEGFPFRKSSSVNVIDGAGVGEHGFFFEVADEAVARTRRDEVGEEEGVEEYALGAEDHGLHEEAWFGHFKKGEEVHTFVVGFFQEGFDPGRWN